MLMEIVQLQIFLKHVLKIKIILIVFGILLAKKKLVKMLQKLILLMSNVVYTYKHVQYNQAEDVKREPVLMLLLH